MPEPAVDPRYDEVDQALRAWRQGDCVLGPHWFAHRIDPDFPLTAAAAAAAKGGADLAEEETAGLVVISQTCDVVRSCKDRPFVDVSPLVMVEESRIVEIERGYRPAFGFVPRLASQRLVADLDRVMSIEKPIVSKWRRTPGLDTDDEARAFSRALARKRARSAFPDDFERFVANLKERITKKHARASPEGRALQDLREIRVMASPRWNEVAVSLRFLFIGDLDDTDCDGAERSKLLDRWLALVPATGRFHQVDGQVATLEELTASDYVHSDPLDLDHLSTDQGESSA